MARILRQRPWQTSDLLPGGLHAVSLGSPGVGDRAVMIEDWPSWNESMPVGVVGEEVNRPHSLVPDPRPVVNWGHINHKAVRNLPKPVLCPVKGVSQDPALYETKKKLNSFTNRTETLESPFASRSAPFGRLLGLQTSHGVISMPEVPVHGYVWCKESAAWVIAANTG